MSRKLSQTMVTQVVGQTGSWSVCGLTLWHVISVFLDVCTCGKNTKKQSHEARDEHISFMKKVRNLVGRNMLLYEANTAITAPFTLLNCALQLTMRGGLVSSANPRISAPVVVWTWGSVSLQQREELPTVLVKVVTDCLRTFRARLGAHTVAADVVA